MHTNPSFRRTDSATALAFARSRSFGTLVHSAEGCPNLSHIPFLLSDDGQQVHLHLTRSNPIARACTTPQPVTLAVSGPDGYISPDWYEMDDQVPTWNYVAVHLAGRLHAEPPETLEPLLVRQSQAFETFLPKRPWTMDKMTEDARAKMMRMILPFRLEIEDIQSTFKLGQNKPEEARKKAAAKLEDGFGTDLATLAQLMRHPPEAT